MRIAPIDEALDLCREHLSPAGSVDARIEALLTQALLVLIYAEFESKYRRLIEERCNEGLIDVQDDNFSSFVRSYTKDEPRSLRSGEIAGLLGRFGKESKRDFRQKLGNNQQAEHMYDSIVTIRNRLAHGGERNATFLDVARYYEEGHVVLDYFRDALDTRNPSHPRMDDSGEQEHA